MWGIENKTGFHEPGEGRFVICFAYRKELSWLLIFHCFRSWHCEKLREEENREKDRKAWLNRFFTVLDAENSKDKHNLKENSKLQTQVRK